MTPAIQAVISELRDIQAAMLNMKVQSVEVHLNYNRGEWTMYDGEVDYLPHNNGRWANGTLDDTDTPEEIAELANDLAYQIAQWDDEEDDWDDED